MQQEMIEVSDQYMQIRKMFKEITNATTYMNNTFEKAILKHEEQFIKSYRTKIYQLVSIFNQLKQKIEENIINDVLNNKLQTVLKQRDYFKYESLKLNSQYQLLLEDYKNINAQKINTTEQMNIYKHLFKDQKQKNAEIEKNSSKIKKNLTELTVKTVQNRADILIQRPITSTTQKQNKIKKVITNELKHKETIRMLKQKLALCQNIITQNQYQKVEKKQLYDVFKICVQSWKRQIISKSRKSKSNHFHHSNNINVNMDVVSSLKKKQLLKLFFTHPDFLKFIQQLLFDDHVLLTLQKSNEKVNLHHRNRITLCQYIRKKTTINHAGKSVNIL